MASLSRLDLENPQNEPQYNKDGLSSEFLPKKLRWAYICYNPFWKGRSHSCWRRRAWRCFCRKKLTKLGGENGIGFYMNEEPSCRYEITRAFMSIPGGTILWKKVMSWNTDNSRPWHISLQKTRCRKIRRARIQRQMVLTSSRSSCGFCRQHSADRNRRRCLSSIRATS